MENHLKTGWLPDDAQETHKLSLEEALKEVHEGICGHYFWGRAFTHKITQLGFYWPSILASVKAYVKKCNTFQRHVSVVRQHPERLTSISSPIPFVMWGMDILELALTLIAHPQANGQAEVANRIILDGLKKRAESPRNTWVDEFLAILWGYHTTYKNTTKATSFMLVYRADRVVPLEITHGLSKVKAYEAGINEEGMRLALDLFDKVSDEANTSNAKHPNRASLYYKRRVRERIFQQEDLVLRKIEVLRVGEKGKLAPNWEGP
ncbi:uncharacterized protein LOC141666072 [Apium graveolens]|uniref:uncharacterized protein LOC141666072 n=1 Tax=Apium graveolens TaxID=4045 RepID=UPI003D78B8A9